MPVCVLRLLNWMRARSPKATIGAVFQQNGKRSNVSPVMARWEAEVQRLVLGLAVTATMLCCASAARAQAVICPLLPPWYPRGLGIDGALSMRHLCLWTFLLLTSLLPLSSLPAPA
jgi:hypothetical protein